MQLESLLDPQTQLLPSNFAHTPGFENTCLDLNLNALTTEHNASITKVFETFSGLNACSALPHLL
jgi:hypothetical protein